MNMFRSIYLSIIAGLFLLASGNLLGQPGYFPILDGDKYGLANEKMEIVLPPVYHEVITHEGAPIALVKTDGGWDIIGKEGRVILKNVLQGTNTQNYSGPTGVSIHRAFSKTLPEDSGKFLNVALYKISDPEYKRTYFINPYAPLTSYIPYQLPQKKSYWSFADPAPDQVMTGLIKVVMEDGKTNFIDTSGHLVLKENVTEAAAYGSNVIVVMDENNLFRVYDRQQRLLSENVYEHVFYKKKSGHIQLRKPIPGTDSQYDLFDSQGAMLLSDRNLIASGTEEFIIEYDLEGAYLYNGQGVLRKSFPAAKLFFNDVNYNLPLLIINNKIGLIDSEGKIVLEPVYDNLLPMRDSTMAFKKGTRGGILDKTLKEKWSMDSIEIKEFIRESPGHYEIHHIRDHYSGYGVANINGKVIVPPIYKSVSHIKQFNFFIAKGDPVSEIYDVNGKMLTRIQADKYEFNFPEINVRTADSVKVYDRSFRMIHAWDRAKEELDSYKKGDAYGMKNTTGQVVTEAVYSDIRRIKETVSGKWGYYARYEEEDNEIKGDFLNQFGKKINPSDYKPFESHAQSSSPEKMPFIVSNEEDVENELWFPREGLIDITGQWIIEPDYQEVHVIGHQVIVTTNAKTLERKFYDLQGNVINTKPYQYFNSLAQDGIHNDRVIVGYEANDSLQNLSIRNGMRHPFENEIAARQGDRSYHYQPKYLKGAIDSKGREIIPCKYDELHDFIFTKTSFKLRDKNGETYTGLIDLNGKELLRTQYDAIEIFPLDSTIFKFEQQGKTGILSLTGKVLVKPIYEEIRINYKPKTILAKDSLYTYIIPINNPEQPYNIGPANHHEIDTFHNGNFVVYIRDKAAGSKINHYSIFDKDEKLLSQGKGYKMKTFHPGWHVPEGYTVMQDTPESKMYLMNYKTGQKFKKE